MSIQMCMRAVCKLPRKGEVRSRQIGVIIIIVVVDLLFVIVVTGVWNKQSVGIRSDCNLTDQREMRLRAVCDVVFNHVIF